MDRNHERFFKALDIYKPPSKASLDKLRTGKVEIGGKTITVTAPEQAFIEKLSKRIVPHLPSPWQSLLTQWSLCRFPLSLLQDLDAIEACKIFRNFIKYQATGRFAYDSETSMREVGLRWICAAQVRVHL